MRFLWGQWVEDGSLASGGGPSLLPRFNPLSLLCSQFPLKGATRALLAEQFRNSCLPSKLSTTHIFLRFSIVRSSREIPPQIVPVL